MKDKSKIKIIKREGRHKKIRAKISGTAKRPRLNVFRSNQGMYLQLIDDAKGATIASAGLGELSRPNAKSKISESRYFELGKLIAEKALKKKIKQVVFDRGGYKYHGRVKAAAEGARSAGLEF